MNHLCLKITCTLLFLFMCITDSYAQQLSFQYDAAGNQISRSWICINCTQQLSGPTAEHLNLLDQSSLVKEEEKLAVTRSLTAYPNPVSETLNLKWTAENGVFIKSVGVFSLGGLKVFQESYSPQQSQSAISFTSIPAGGYLLRALYSDGKKEVVKIIKQ